MDSKQTSQPSQSVQKLLASEDDKLDGYNDDGHRDPYDEDDDDDEVIS